MRNKVVISTREETEETIALAQNKGVRLHLLPAREYQWSDIPVQQVEKIKPGIPWVFTSKRGVEGWHFQRHKFHMGVPEDIYVIGPKTAEACRHLFCIKKVNTPNDFYGEALGALLKADGIVEAIHFCGKKRREELGRFCRSNDVVLHELEVYSGKQARRRESINQPIDGVLFFSPEGVKDFLCLYGILPGEWKAVAIGETTAEAVFKFYSKQALIPKEAKIEHMITLI